MTGRPWWLWEGAAVRIMPEDIIAECGDVHKDGTVWACPPGDDVLGEWFPVDSITPIENPAVMLAPEGATHVHISVGSARVLYVDKNDNYYEPGPTDFTWPQCPESLKGHTWELPRRKA